MDNTELVAVRAFVGSLYVFHTRLQLCAEVVQHLPLTAFFPFTI